MRPAKIVYDYKMPAADLLGTDRAANLAFFLIENGENVWGKWTGRIHAADQRKLFGKVIGRGFLRIDGSEETVSHIISVAFGAFRDSVSCDTFRNLNQKA
jgi:hypothetical protein